MQVRSSLVAVRACLILLTLFEAGCADRLVSDDRLRSKTATFLGVPEGTVSITNRRFDGTNATFYDAAVGRKVYKCIVTGGGALQLGLISGISCDRRRSNPSWIVSPGVV